MLQEFAGVLLLPAPPRGFLPLRARTSAPPASSPLCEPPRRTVLAKPGGRRSSPAPHVCLLLSTYHIRDGAWSIRVPRPEGAAGLAERGAASPAVRDRIRSAHLTAPERRLRRGRHVSSSQLGQYRSPALIPAAHGSWALRLSAG